MTRQAYRRLVSSSTSVPIGFLPRIQAKIRRPPRGKAGLRTAQAAGRSSRAESPPCSTRRARASRGRTARGRSRSRDRAPSRACVSSSRSPRLPMLRALLPRKPRPVVIDGDDHAPPARQPCGSAPTDTVSVHTLAWPTCRRCRADCRASPRGPGVRPGSAHPRPGIER